METRKNRSVVSLSAAETDEIEKCDSQMVTSVPHRIVRVRCVDVCASCRGSAQREPVSSFTLDAV
jgi:hypothetical protein